jgi:hypothetical protein
MKILLAVGFLTIGMMQTTVNAQVTTVAQSSVTIQQAINNLSQDAPDDVIKQLINNALTEQGITLSAEALVALTENKEIAFTFVSNLVKTNDVYEATKLTIENSSADEVDNIVTVTIALFPVQAQEVVDALVFTDALSATDAVLAAITAGADATTVSEDTAAGGNIPDAPGNPNGGDNGAGPGDEDPSAS